MSILSLHSDYNLAGPGNDPEKKTSDCLPTSAPNEAKKQFPTANEVRDGR
jgi:hypothetical protein